MFKSSAFVVTLFLSTASLAADLTPRAAGELLASASVALIDGTKTICSAAKIGPAQFLTAAHCVGAFKEIKTRTGRLLKPKSVLVPLQAKGAIGLASKKEEDWAVINTVADDTAVKALPLGCDVEPYLGLAVAYAGYPVPTTFTLGLGNITTAGPMDSQNDADYGMSAPGSGGASGSPVISLETGSIIGVLTEVVYGDRKDIYMTALESIKNTDMCDTSSSDNANDARVK